LNFEKFNIAFLNSVQMNDRTNNSCMHTEPALNRKVITIRYYVTFRITFLMTQVPLKPFQQMVSAVTVIRIQVLPN